ncbi:MAG TPA: TonB-dependent receptor [Bacteroidales bacterium]|nr:TonB-dependent receptor [Bacteroidales bacterium]
MYRAKSKSLFLIGFLLLSIQTIAQTGKLEGVITDKNTKETLVGANVIIVGTTIGALADLDGHYVIDNIKPGTYNIQLSFISYKPLVLEGIKIEAGKTTQLNTELEEVSVTLGNVEVVAVKRGGTEISMINAIKANQLVASGISSQQIQRSQDRDASEVVKRVPGITIIDDRFIVVRGLNQRYNNVWLNNAATPSSETDVKAFSFDAIPSSMIENLMIYKSSAPEIPADFSGGFIKIFTKNMPDENTYSIGYSTSFSPGTTFSDFYRFGSKNDNWTGFDNKRELPSYFPSNLQNVSANDQVELSKRLDNTWTPSLKTALPDQRVNFSMSHRMKLGNNTFGVNTCLNSWLKIIER